MSHFVATDDDESALFVPLGFYVRQNVAFL